MTLLTPVGLLVVLILAGVAVALLPMDRRIATTVVVVAILFAVFGLLHYAGLI